MSRCRVLDPMYWLYKCEPDIGNWKSEIGNWKSEIGNWKSEIGNWKSEIGNWKLEIGNRELEMGNRANGANKASMLSLPMHFAGRRLATAMLVAAFTPVTAGGRG